MKWIVFLCALVACMGAAAAQTPSPTVTDKPCEEINERFACRRRPDCVWVGAVVGCQVGDASIPSPVSSPPTTRAPTKAPTSKAPTTKRPTAAPVLVTKRPTNVPAVPSKRPTEAPAFPTKRPTAPPTLRRCGTFTTRTGCLDVGGADRCEWFESKCINIRTKRPTKSPTNHPTKRPTAAPSTSPTVSPSRAPTYAKKCANYNNKQGCCGRAFANGSANKCVNDKVAPPGCRWRITRRQPREVGVCEPIPGPDLPPGYHRPPHDGAS